MKAIVTVMLKPGVLDPQGKAIAHALGTLGFATAGRGTFDAFWESVAAPFEVHRRVLEAIERYGRRRD